MIDFRPLTRPLPLLLICLFAAVAMVDMVHHLCQPPEPLPDLLREGSLFFEAVEPVVDLRPRTGEVISLGPMPRLVGEGWSGDPSLGIWITRRRAALELDIGRGGYRVLVIECRPAQGRQAARTLEVRVNGSSSGVLKLARGWRRYRLELDEGTVRQGVNRIEFIVSAGGNSAARRRLLLKRFGLFLSKDAGVDSLPRRSPVSRNLARDVVVIRRPGTLELPFVLDDRADALRLRCHFVGGGGKCVVAVTRPQGTGAGLDPAIRREFAFTGGGSTGVRIPVHGRRGEFILSIDADLDPGQGKLVLSAPRLVRETGRSQSTEEGRR